jgi:hypothetical protein
MRSAPAAGPTSLARLALHDRATVGTYYHERGHAFFFQAREIVANPDEAGRSGHPMPLTVARRANALFESVKTTLVLGGAQVYGMRVWDGKQFVPYKGPVTYAQASGWITSPDRNSTALGYLADEMLAMAVGNMARTYEWARAKVAEGGLTDELRDEYRSRMRAAAGGYARIIIDGQEVYVLSHTSLSEGQMNELLALTEMGDLDKDLARHGDQPSASAKSSK